MMYLKSHNEGDPTETKYKVTDLEFQKTKIYLLHICKSLSSLPSLIYFFFFLWASKLNKSTRLFSQIKKQKNRFTIFLILATNYIKMTS